MVAVCLTIGANAQYTFSTFTEDYQLIENGTEIVENDYDENIWDDPEFEIELGFSFPFGEEEYTNLIQDDYGAFLLFENNSNTEAAFAYESDIMDAELETPSSPSIISYVTEGEVGSMILKVQYDNCGFYNAIEELVGGEASNRVNFQMWFYESGTLEMRFGTNSITDNQLVHEGPGPSVYMLIGVPPFSSEWYFAGLSGDPSNPTLVLDVPTNEEAIPHLQGNPGDGRVYRFAPTSVGVNEVSISNLKLYPTQAEQTIFIDGIETPNAIYHIADITGKIQKTGMVNQGEGIDVSNLNNGLYLFQVEGYSNALKFVKLK